MILKMKKFLTIIIILLAVSFQAAAQVDYSFGNIKKKRNKTNVPIAGFKGGFTFYNMHFSDKIYNDLPGNTVMAPGYGIFAEYPLRTVKNMSVGVELMLIEKGYVKEFNARPNGVNISKKEQINANYADFRIPVSYRFMSKKVVNPYVFMAADIAFCYGGTQKHEFPDNEEYVAQSVDISQSDAVMKPIDISLLAGAGVRFNIRVNRSIFVIKLDGAYNLGLLNVKSQTEGNITNVNAWSSKKTESWNNRGLEVMLSLGIPLKYDRREGACTNWD